MHVSNMLRTAIIIGQSMEITGYTYEHENFRL